MIPRLLVAALVPAVVAGGLALPVVEWSGATDRAPVTPQVRTMALSGVDPAAVRESSAAMASWSDLVHDHDAEFLGLATNEPATPVGEPDEPLEPIVATPPVETDTFGLVGILADEPFDPDTQIVVRVREDEGWSDWYALVVSDHLPDPESVEARDVVHGTEPLLASQADAYQVRIDTPGGVEPEGMELVLVDNAVDGADEQMLEARSLPVSTASAGAWSAPMPTIITRAEWGADESMRRAGPKFGPTIKAGFVHHTASSSKYRPEQGAQQVRNLYAWFTKGRKYSDMAYNFLVDRYGRIYEGRGGGLDQPVVGAHTAGFNAETFAVAAIGNYQSSRPRPDELAAVTESISSVLAWKLAMHHRDPNGTTALISESGSGTSRYPAGSTATAQVVGGHGDIGSTQCPGRFLSAQLPTIRSAAAAKIGASMFNPAVVGQATYAGGEPLTVAAATNAPLNWQMTVTSRCGTVVRTLAGAQEAPGELRADWDLRDDAGNPVPPGVYSLALQAQAGEEQVYPWVGSGRIAATADAPPDPCGAPESFTLTGAGFGHGVGMSQWGAYAMALEGRDAASIVTHYYSGTSVAPVQDDMDVRINLLYQVNSARVRGEPADPGGGQVEVVLDGRSIVAGPSEAFTFTARGGSVGVEYNGADQGTASNVTVRWGGTRNPGAAGGVPSLLNVIGPRGSFNSAGHRYRYGHVEITPTTSSGGPRLNVVNVLRVHEEYLYGISEVPNSWPEAALQAQVLAARSYALNKIDNGVRRACNCHMDNGRGPYSDQSFTGWSKTSSAKGNRWVRAVDATAASETTGLAILHDGKPINAFYSSSSGGRTNASRDVWGGDLPYVQGVDDPWSLHPDNPNRSWTVQVSQADLAKAFGVREVYRLAIADQTGAGAARSVQATLADGSTVTRTGSQLRSALGLRSAHITAINGEGTGAPPPPDAPAPPAQAAPPAEASPDAAVGAVTMKIRPGLTPKRGTSLVLRGKVKAGGRHVIQRQALVNGEWQTVQTTRSKKNGRYRMRTPKARPVGAELTYRVVAVKKQQVVGISRQLTVTVQPKKKG
jgi:SpoIID/LytB domain protein